MTQQLVFDEDAARVIEAIYEIGDAVRRRALVREALGAQPGESVLDVGCGPGFYCAELAAEVGTSGRVVGVDASEAMLGLAQRRCAGLAQVELRPSDATTLPAADGEFDAALSVQVLEYVADVGPALSELHRVLRPGGRVLVWDIDWATLSMHTEDPQRNARVLAAWDEHLHDPVLPRTLAPRLRAAGFAGVRMTAHPFATAALDPDTYGAAITGFLVEFVKGRQSITADEAAAWLEEQRALDADGRFYFALTQLCFTARKRG